MEENKLLWYKRQVGLRTFLDVCSVILFTGCFLLILQPLFADGQALSSDAGQAGAWAMFYRYGSIGVAGLWATGRLIPRRMVKRLPDVAALVLMGCVIWEAVVALDQLYGSGMSNHALFRFTGTFLNPGPFCGFIAIGVPLAVHGLLAPSDSPKGGEMHLPIPPRWREKWKCLAFDFSPSGGVGRGFCLLTLILCLLLLPAGMSRSAWGAATVGGMAVYGMHRWAFVKEWCGTLLHSRKRLLAVGSALVLCIGVGWGAFHLKEDSANGRLFMWKMACHAFAERPWTGYGADGFPRAYAEAQERYFASGQGTEGERHVAGTPDHAFNEYLTMAVRYGIGGLAIMSAIGIAAFVCAVRNQAYGMAGALLAVAVFAFSSYPLQLPDFLAAVVVLVVAPIVTRGSLVTRRWSLLVLVPLLYWGMRNAEIWQSRHEAAGVWRNVRSLYHMEAYGVVCEDYAPLYERMRWNHNYLFEYGRALHRTGKYEESDRILQEAERLCGDPMILNIQGKNCEALGRFDQAAALYRRAYNRLPNRLYPLYLEMEMYASPTCNRMEDARKIALKLLHTEEKIPSQAVEEMKGRAKEILAPTTD